MSAQLTPRPWAWAPMQFEKWFEITAEGSPYWIAKVRTEEEAAHIVLAANAFEAMRDALKAVISAPYPSQYADPNQAHAVTCPCMRCAVERARAALKLAEPISAPEDTS